jgi:flavin-dependent dehydrogenase
MTGSDHFDLVIVGGNPGGITAAIAAARLGRRSLILERTAFMGGLPANGLGAIDINTRGATEGLFLEFVQRVKAYYIETYGPDSVQVRDCSDGYHFEPAVAQKVFTTWINEHPQITVLINR